MNETNEKKKILIVAGPTAVGKTQYAIELAESLHGEIVSSDSMQLYKFMDIGSAKPTPEELARAKHHMVDEIDPREKFSVALYQKKAKAYIDDILKRGKLPIISGGTGLYVNSLIYDMDFSAPPEDSGYRAELEGIAAEKGELYLHQLLKDRSPEMAERIHPNNVKKVIRALEAFKQSGEDIPPFENSFVKTSDYSCILIGLERDRQELYDRVNLRVDKLISLGLVEEVKGLMDMGLTADSISMKGIGYKEIIGYLEGEYDLERAIYLIKRNTRRYAKRQLTWFRRLSEMHWFNLSLYQSEDQAAEEILSWVKNEIKSL